MSGDSLTERAKELVQLVDLVERALDERDAARQQLIGAYAEMKARYPEFWRHFGFQAKHEYLVHFDLTALITPH